MTAAVPMTLVIQTQMGLRRGLVSITRPPQSRGMRKSRRGRPRVGPVPVSVPRPRIHHEHQPPEEFDSALDFDPTLGFPGERPPASPARTLPKEGPTAHIGPGRPPQKDFDSTLGYPGEGPVNAPDAPLSQAEMAFNQARQLNQAMLTSGPNVLDGYRPQFPSHRGGVGP